MNWTPEQYRAHVKAQANTAKQMQGAKRGGSKPSTCPSEDQEQKNLMSWAWSMKVNGERLADYLIHVPNGGSRNKIEAAKFKAMGLRAGVPDLLLVMPSTDHHGLWIELKSKKGKVQDNQKHVMEQFSSKGYLCKVCYGFKEARDAILDYLGIDDGSKAL